MLLSATMWFIKYDIIFFLLLTMVHRMSVPKISQNGSQIRPESGIFNRSKNKHGKFL